MWWTIKTPHCIVSGRNSQIKGTLLNAPYMVIAPAHGWGGRLNDGWARAGRTLRARDAFPSNRHCIHSAGESPEASVRGGHCASAACTRWGMSQAGHTSPLPTSLRHLFLPGHPRPPWHGMHYEFPSKVGGKSVVPFHISSNEHSGETVLSRLGFEYV